MPAPTCRLPVTLGGGMTIENGSAAARWGRPARNAPVCSQRAETRRSIAAKSNDLSIIGDQSTLRARQRTVDWKAFLAGSLAARVENREEALTLSRRRKSTREAGPEASRKWSDPVEGRPPTWIGFRDKWIGFRPNSTRLYKTQHSRYINQNVINSNQRSNGREARQPDMTLRHSGLLTVEG
jgi:hypothetical protein